MDVYQRRRLVALSALAAIFIIVVLLIRSCGDDEEEPVTPVAGTTGAGGATALSAEDFVDQGDAICLQANTTLAGVDESDPAAEASGEAEIIAGQLQQLQTLTLAPEEDGQDRLDNFLDALQQQVAAYEEYITALERGDETATAEIEAQLDETAGDAAAAARKFGFEVCGDPEQVDETESPAEEDVPTEAETAPVAPTETVEPTVPAPPPVPTTPAPTTEGGGTTPPVTPAPEDGGDSGSGGISP